MNGRQVQEMRVWAYIVQRWLRAGGELAERMSETRSRFVWKDVR